MPAYYLEVVLDPEQIARDLMAFSSSQSEYSMQFDCAMQAFIFREPIPFTDAELDGLRGVLLNTAAGEICSERIRVGEKEFQLISCRSRALGCCFGQLLSLQTLEAIPRMFQQFIIIFSALTLAVFVLLGLFVQREIAQPTRRLLAAFDDTARGRFDTHVDNTANAQEYRQLAESFNSMNRMGMQMMKNMIDTLRSLRGSFGYDPIQGTPTFDIKLGDITNPAYTLEEIFACMEQAEQRCIVAIDEFQQIVNYPEKNVEALLRTHIQHSSNANFIFAGSERHIMNEMFLDYARPFYQSATILTLSPISKEKYAEFVTRHFEGNGMMVMPEAIDVVYDVFQGNTYYLQKTFREAFAASVGGKTCDIAMVEGIIDSMIEESHHRYSETLARLTLAQKELLYAIVEEGKAQRITSGQFIKRHSLQSPSSVQAAMKKLMEYGIVTVENNEYSVEDQLFYRWLLNS